MSTAETSNAHSPFSPLVCVVDFHHHRGPEIEKWFGASPESSETNEWPLLPFLALSDGAHSVIEEFSYFTLRHITKADGGLPSSLFGIACTRHIDSQELLVRPEDVTRSASQKAVVVILESPGQFPWVREQLSAVTKAWFAGRDLTNFGIIEEFQQSLADTSKKQTRDNDQYFGMSLRELVHEYRHKVLVLFKCCLLQPKMLFFGSHSEKLCMLQFALISLIPGLIRNLQDCADPNFNSYEENLVIPTSLKSSERASLLAYMGLPLQLFGKGSFFGPYTPLQQLDLLTDKETKSFVVGSTNALFLQHKDKYSDIVIHLDDQTINISSPSLRSALALSVADRRWIDFITQSVMDTWDDANPTRPTTHGYTGSEDFIRIQFEEYLMALLSSVKYRRYVEKHQKDPKSLVTDGYGFPANDFSSEWVDAWQRTENFRVFDKFTDSHLFDIVEPRHPCAGGLTIEDVQRRVAQQLTDLHLDEHLNTGREVLNKHLSTGQQKVSSAFNKVWADVELMRENQRRRQEDRKAATTASASASGTATAGPSPVVKAPDLAQAQAAVQAASLRAGAYLSSWGAWATEKRRTGWTRASTEEDEANEEATKQRVGDVSKYALRSKEEQAKADAEVDVVEKTVSR